jgi:hypothetical protein
MKLTEDPKVQVLPEILDLLELLVHPVDQFLELLGILEVN